MTPGQHPNATLELERDALQEELAEVQAQLAHALARWEQTFQALPAAAFVVDGLGSVQRWNRLSLAWLGSEKSPGGMPLARLMRLRHTAVLDRTLSEALAGAEAELVLATPLVSPRHRDATVVLRLHRLDQADGCDPRLLATLVAQSPGREAAPPPDPQLLHDLLDSTGDLVYAVDMEGRILAANSAVGRLLGQPVEDLLGRHRDQLLPAADTLMHHPQDSQVLRNGHTVELHEEFHGAPHAGRLHFQTRKFPLREASGRVVGVGGVSRDVTDETHRHHQRQLSELVFHQSSDAIAVLDVDGVLLRVNPAFAQLAGAHEDLLRGRALWVVQPQMGLDPQVSPFWPTVVNQQGWSGEIDSKRLDGQRYTVRSTLSPLRDDAGRLTGYALVQSNLTHLRRVQAQAERLAAQDELTALPNRRVMLDRLEQLILYARRRETPFALLFLDLDHFKEVNDTLGHQVGDALLCQVADRLRGLLRGQDTVARNGGDEFVILLPDTHADAALQVGQKLVDVVGEPVDLAGLANYRPSLSVGVVGYPQDGAQGEVLLRNADSAMYAAKAAGRRQVMAYNQAMSQQAADFLDIQTSLPDALRHGELQLYFQPKFRIADRRIVGAEALVRWQRPGLGLVEPKSFLPAAQRSGLLTVLDDWVLDEAVATAARWHGQGLLPTGWRLSVNQAAPDIKRTDWLQHLLQRLAQGGLPAQHLEIELTEGLLAQPTAEVLDNLSRLRDSGVSLSIDDFGTGYSSMSYLKSLPITVLKIDGSFIRDLADDPNDRSLVEAMISLGHKLGHETVAECVETEAQCEMLARIGCEVGQGFLLSEPVPADVFEDRFLSAVSALSA